MSIATAPKATTNSDPATPDPNFWTKFWAEMGPIVAADMDRGREIIGRSGEWVLDPSKSQGGYWGGYATKTAKPAAGGR